MHLTWMAEFSTIRTSRSGNVLEILVCGGYFKDIAQKLWDTP